MERLTERVGDYIRIKGCESLYLNEERKAAPASSAIVRLAAYEDTGLGPDEITTKPYECVFYCNRKCNLDGDFCAEGPGCPREIDAGTAKRLLELSQAEKDGRLVVLPDVSRRDRKLFVEGLMDYFQEASLYDPSVGIFGMREGEIELASALMNTLTREEADAALKKREEGNEAVR